MTAILVFALLPIHATAPSNFSVNGFASMDACNYARAEMGKQHAPFGKNVILWSVCVPSGAPSAPHKD